MKKPKAVIKDLKVRNGDAVKAGSGISAIGKTLGGISKQFAPVVM
jgi:hypothetical protein